MHHPHPPPHLDPLTTPRPVLVADSSHPAVGYHELSTRTWNHFYTDRIFCIFHQLTSWRRRLLAAAAVVFPLVWRGTWKFSEILRTFSNYIILYLKQEHIFVTLTKTNKQRSETLITKKTNKEVKSSFFLPQAGKCNSGEESSPTCCAHSAAIHNHTPAYTAHTGIPSCE